MAPVRALCIAGFACCAAVATSPGALPHQDWGAFEPSLPYRPDPPGRRFSRSLSAKRAVRFSEDTALSHRRSRPRSVARDTYDGQEARTNEFFRAYMSAKFFVKRFRESQKIEDRWFAPQRLTCSSSSAMKHFARSIADGLVRGRGGSWQLASHAEQELELLASRCALRCECAEQVDGEFGASCDAEEPGQTECKRHCECIRNLVDELSWQVAILEVPRIWAQAVKALSEKGVALSPADLANTVRTTLLAQGALQGHACPVDAATRFAVVASEELGPSFRVGTSAVWSFLEAEGCAGKDPGALAYGGLCHCFLGIYRRMISEEVRSVFHEHCGLDALDVDCVFRHWAKRDLCAMLSNAGIDPLRTLFGGGLDVQDHIRSTVRRQCGPALEPGCPQRWRPVDVRGV